MWTDIAIHAVKAAIVLGALMGALAYMTLLERRLIARIQDRIGPNRVGPFGLLQPIADGLKLFLKEDVMPETCDRALYLAAPLLAIVTGLIGFAIVPFGSDLHVLGRTVKLQVADVNIGVLYVLAVAAVGVYSVAIGGWASNSKYSFLGGLRSAAQMISYEVAMGLAIVSPFLVAGSLSPSQIVAAQQNAIPWLPILPNWFIFTQPLAFLLYMVCAFAETNRLPFDLPEAETELGAGFHTEYSGIKFGWFMLGEYANIVTACAIGVTLFLGGWTSPFPWLPFTNALPFTVAWFVLKLLLCIVFFMLVRGTLPRFRYDQLMGLGWKLLIPVALVNVVGVAILLLLVPRFFGVT